ncbi:hypothetical protein ACGFZS_47025 [Streptomyces sp. NPDC048288]|uniref:hypothetical protein n=1 Tax=Streptomyces sp. NPDC048288 TaxID=3365529 RepID=UPI0037195415
MRVPIWPGVRLVVRGKQRTDAVKVAAEALAAELHRRSQRLEELQPDPGVCNGVKEQLHGELVGLRGALGIVLGGHVMGGTADALGFDYYQGWLGRREGRS